MRIGEPQGVAGRHCWQRGFTYLLLLFVLVIGGIGLSALGEVARQRAWREQEAELQFRGTEIASAIASYVDASPGTSRTLPARIDDLLEDRRSGRVVRHLRQWRPDPLGGRWVLLAPGEGGCSASLRPAGQAIGISGVRSDSRRLLLRREGDEAKPACELVFHHQTFLLKSPSPPAAIAVSP
jgi:type II secretory pathway pseudopilin PulG